MTTNTLHTHAGVAQRISAAGGDYLLPVKDNQPRLREDIALVFASAATLADAVTQAQSTDAHGDRIETCRLRASAALVGYTDFPAHQQVLELRRTITNKRTGTTREELVYGITSLAPHRATAAELLKLWREHWHIENKLHYVRDVTFDEGRSQVRTQRITQVMATLRNVTISLLRVSGATNIAAACRRYAAQPALALAAVGISRRE